MSKRNKHMGLIGMGVKMLDTEYRHRNNEIYFHFGGRNQLQQTKSENYEMLDALQKFILYPNNKEIIKNIKEEVADRIIMIEQMTNNSKGSIREDFFKHLENFNDFIIKEGLGIALNTIIDGFKDEIKEIIKTRIDRTLERVEAGVYRKLMLEGKDERN